MTDFDWLPTPVRDVLLGRTPLPAMPVLLGALGILAIAYRYYSAFLAAKVVAFDDTRVTPAHRLDDGQNYHPTSKWVLFGHHFAAISGAGPLIGPVLALQYGYAPGLLWLIIGVCLAGAVQDMLVMAASVRHDGKSLAAIARDELGRPAAVVVSAAILFIVVIALAGLSFVVVKALGGEEAKLSPGTRIALSADGTLDRTEEGGKSVWKFPAGCTLTHPGATTGARWAEPFAVVTIAPLATDADRVVTLPEEHKSVLRIRGSSWGTFTIACTIPIALFVGWYMYRLRPGRTVEASLIGGVMVLAAVVGGHEIRGTALEAWFDLTREQTILALAVYGVAASVLPVWLLLTPRDYLSSFLKIGTIGLLVAGVILANPRLVAPPLNPVFMNEGPTFPGSLFPFVFICVMCGAISGFHALVSSGTTPKMVDRESHIRPIGYGAMLMEGLVGIVALIAAAALPPELYYGINVDLDREAQYRDRIAQVVKMVQKEADAGDRMHAAGVDAVQHLPLGQVEEQVGETLRGRTGGAVTLAVGMSVVFSDAVRQWTGLDASDARIRGAIKYWYHFAIMFEALFILTTIDAGTRIARFLVQEAIGQFYAPFGRPDWLPGALLTSVGVTAGWAVLVSTGSIDTIWSMFGIANQLLAVLALALVTTWLVNTGRGRYAPVTLAPMVFVVSTTLSAASLMVTGRFAAMLKTPAWMTGALNIGLTVFVTVSVVTLLVLAAARWVTVAAGWAPTRPDAPRG
jgi:carbon starvation protein